MRSKVILFGIEGVLLGAVLQYGQLYAPYHLLWVAAAAYAALRVSKYYVTVLPFLWLSSTACLLLRKYPLEDALYNSWDALLPVALAVAIYYLAYPLARLGARRARPIVSGAAAAGAGAALGALAGLILPAVPAAAMVPAASVFLIPFWGTGRIAVLYAAVFALACLAVLFGLFWHGPGFLFYSPYEFAALYWPFWTAALFFGVLPVLLFSLVDADRSVENDASGPGPDTAPGRCPDCGTVNDPDCRYCAECGRELQPPVKG